MRWTLELLDAARTELDALPADMRARFLHIAKLLEEFGPQHVGEPHVRHLGEKLWEMRLTGRDGIARALYFAAEGRRLLVVHVFRKKTHKTPRRVLELARKRIEEYRRAHRS